MFETLSLVRRAEYYARLKHGNQAYNDELPYTWHLEQVVNVVKKFGQDAEIIEAAAWGHDLCEDAGCSYNDIKKRFGEEVAEIVYLVTDEKGRNRKERHEKTYPALAKNEKAVIVKLADRIANVEAGLSSKDGKVEMYRSEYKYFKDTLFNEEHDEKTLQMWKYLDQLLK